MFLPVQGSSSQQTKEDSSYNGVKRLEDQGVGEQERMTCQPEISKNQNPPLEDTESTKENTAAFPCWQKGCNKVLTSSSALQTHINQIHSQRPQMPISDRHVYKYRCTQCSLAFKTAEKLQLHSQYHAIRAATMCCLCQRSFRTLQALRKHLETSHLELSEAQLQQLCGSLLMTEDLLGGEDQSLGEEQGSFEEERVKEDEESDTEEKLSPGDSYLSLVREDVEPNSKHFVMPQRKGPNVSTEKFLDPSRPFKCTVCKESFTQKNILLVHYNSVSHLHKVKRSVQDSSGLPESVSSSTDHKPFKCSICSVSYSQSSTLEIHMRSVLHQTKARAAKLDTSGPSSVSAVPLLGKAVSLTESTSSSHAALKSMTAVNNLSCTSSTLDQPQLNHQQSTNVISSKNTRHSLMSEEYKKKQKVEAVTSTTRQHKLLQQHQLVQAQAQIQQELQKKAALLQSHLFNPALLHHFPVTTDTLLPLQQQLLLPFLIPGGEFQINPELNIKGLGLNLSTVKPVAPEDTSESSQQGSLISSFKHLLNGDAACAPNQLLSLAPEEDVPVSQKGNGVTHDLQSNKGIDEQSNNKAAMKVHDPTSRDDIDGFKAQEDLEDEVLSSGEFFTQLIPPRIAHDAPGNVSKALLENIGFELVVQFNENKQQYRRNQAEAVPNEQIMPNTKEVDHSEFFGKLECESCGKLFSNALILKSHKEHIHQSLFPIHSLEKFAKDYRQQYDKLFPFRPATPESSPPPESPASSPSLPTPTEQPHQKAALCLPVSETMVAPPTVPTPQVPLAPLPLPIDLPLFPPLMMHSMPLQALNPQLPIHLPTVEAGIAPDLTQLNQNQLTPALVQHGKRPRTRITDDQLRILRQYFDINNSPNEDQIQDMANKSALPHKVIKHWFRNTLFKERQRNKDSPYNFNNPPITTLEDVKVDSRSSSPDLSRQECSAGKRSSRTRFTDFQLRVLQDFFDANAYPKDDEFEQLSNLLNLTTRVIVVWFQNARQKARKIYENQGEGGKDECLEFSNDRYIRSSNNSFKCKKCNIVFQRIFDLISHQKKVCYKDDDDDDDDDNDAKFDQNEVLIDPKPPTPSESSSPGPTPSTSSVSNCIESNTYVKHTNKEQLQQITVSGSLTEDLKQEATCDPSKNLGNLKLEEPNEELNPQLNPHDEEKLQASTQTCSVSPLQQQSNTCVSQTSPVPSQNSQKNFNSLTSPSQQPQLKPVQQMTPYQCIQCKLSFLSFEHWQEHQQMHFLVAQNPFVPPQFLDRPVDMSLMLFDPANPLLARQLLSGAIPQIPANLPSVAAIPDSTINSLKRKLEQKSGTNSENDWDSNGDDPQRDKRMRTTITPEQLEILYQKYLLDSNPTRQMLDHISQEVGLKKRVVQVWFQNTRARERKGQFRALGPAQAHRRCPFCRALFKAQTALDAHIRSRHWHEAKTAGYSMAMSGMTQESCLQMLNQGDILTCPNSPTAKSMDLSSHQQRVSPKPSKGGDMDDFGVPSVSAQQSFERNKLDNHKSTSLNTVSNGVPTDEDNFPVEGKHYCIDQLSFSSEREASSESEDKLSSGLVSPAMSFNAKDFENDLMLDYSENSSLADPASPCPGGSNGQNIDVDRHGQKRYRTQLSNLQVKVLKACFSDYKTPTMLECEALGNDIGLAKRVVQVWFQNARAKEKKAKLSLAKQFGTESTCTERPKTECTLCCVKYSGCLSVRDHVFSPQHLAKVKEALGGQMDRDREYVDPASVRQVMSQQEADNLKKSSEVLAVVQPQSAEGSGVFNHTTPQYLNLPRAGNTSVASFSSAKSDPSDPPSHGQISRRNASFSSSMSATIEKDPVSTTNSVLTPKNTESDLQLRVSKENNTENNNNNNNVTEKLTRASSGNASHSNSRISKDKKDSFTPAASTPKLGKEYTMEPAQLQALQAAGNIDQTALLSSPLLPCLMPGFPQIFPPQIPTALPGSFLQPMFGMESMFPYSPVLPQALMSLSPGSILQQYQHNLQGALMHHRLQLQQKQLLQQPQKAKTSQISALTHSQDLALNKESVLDSDKPGKSSSSFSPGNTKMDSNFLITQCIVSKATCRERGKDITLYDCLACQISLNGNDELRQHLESFQHRQRAAEQQNAKEHASRLLPHISPSSTSQLNLPNNHTSSPISQPKQSSPDSSSATSCSSSATSHSSRPAVGTPSTSSDQRTQLPSTSTALSGDAQPVCPPVSPSRQLSLPSTVTSSLNGHDMSCHLKPTNSASGCCNNDGSAEPQEST